jgi:trk system potassium uptake protein TrkH
MRWDVIGLVLGWTIRLVAIPLAIIGLFSAYTEGVDYAGKTYLIPILIAGLVSQWFIAKADANPSKKRVRDREAFVAVALGWIPVIALGALPYWLGGTFFGPFEFWAGDASVVELLRGILHSWFESMSGFTTTGATVIDPSTSPICDGSNDCIGSQAKSIILWRSLTQWLGGMGVIMLGLLIFSTVLGGGMNLARAELTGPSVSRLRPSLQSTARRLWLIYSMLTLIEMGLLFFVSEMGLFDSINYSLTTLPTGGFGTTDAGVMAFDSVGVEVILTLFMILAGINFSLYHMALGGRGKDALKDEEFRTFLLIFVLAWLGMAFNLLRHGVSEGGMAVNDALRKSMFQAASIGTSTGYASADFASWPVFSHFVLLLLMIVGASAGSTGGGVKVLRIRIAFELARREVMRIIQPRKVVAMRVNSEPIEENQVWIVIGMLSSWMVLAMASMLAISLLEPGWDMESVLSVVMSSLGNTGPALGNYGPTATWASMGDLTLFWTSLLMWLGRLELLTVLVLLHPRTWAGSGRSE